MNLKLWKHWKINSHDTIIINTRIMIVTIIVISDIDIT